MLLGPTHAFATTFLSTLETRLAHDELWSALATSFEHTAVTCEKIGTAGQAKTLQELVSRTPALLARQLELSEGMLMDATELCLERSQQARALGWSTTNAVVRCGSACMRATQIAHGGDIQSDGAIAELRQLLEMLRPVAL